MSKKVITGDSSILLNTLKTFHQHYTFKLHRMYNPKPVGTNWFIEEHRMNNDLHLMFILDGSGSYSLNHIRKPIKKGKLMIVSNDYPHAASTSYHDPLHIFSLRFGVYSNKYNHFLPSFFESPFALSLTPKDPLVYEQLLNRMYQHFLEQRPESEYAINVLLNQLLLNVCEEPKNMDTSSKIKHITDQIIYSHGKSISVPSLASSLELSTKQFTRLFVKHNHITPYQFIISARINYAKYLLEDTSTPIIDIANELGYADSFCFSKQFKKNVGISPTNFRNFSM